MTTIYVVRGSTGEYSDWDVWTVCAFVSEDKAKERVELASARARELHPNRTYTRIPKWEDGLNEYDPKMKRPDTMGTNYEYEAVEVLDA